jgi:hypothetical protein
MTCAMTLMGQAMPNGGDRTTRERRSKQTGERDAALAGLSEERHELW